MRAATNPIDGLMERASAALAVMDYAQCEALCVEALGRARLNKDWVAFQRVLLPLQEARRQKRQAAIDGPILLGTRERADLGSLVEGKTSGCAVLTWPYNAGDAGELHEWAAAKRVPFEVLFADNAPDESVWNVTSHRLPDLRVALPAPKAEWVGVWTDPLSIPPPTPAHWFMRASEALGDAAITKIDADAPAESPTDLDRLLGTLESLMQAVGDHELLHQRTAQAARALHEASR